MAQRLSEQVVEWLTVGGDVFTPQNFNSTNGNIPLVVSKPGESVTIPATNGTAIGVYNNKGQLWTVGAAGATTSVKSSQLIVSSSDAAAGAGTALELWRGTDVSWQLRADNSTDELIIANNWTTAAQTSYTSNVSFGYGTIANQYVHIYSTLDSNYSYGGASGSALSVAGGITANKKIYFADTTDSNYATKAGALVVEGGVNIAKKVYLRDTTDSSYATVAGSFVTMGGAYIKKKTYIADVTDSNYATKAGSFVTEGGAYIAKKTYIASTTDSNYSTKAGSLVTEGGIYSAKKVYIADATDSNYSTLAGALVVAGGANFGKKVYLKDATDSTSYTTGSLVTAGGVAITKQLRVQGVTTHGGNVLSDTNDTDDIGATATRWKNGYFTTSLNVGAASTSQSSTNAKATYIVPGGINTNTNNTSSSGYFVYGHGKEYGHLYISQFGTANVPATTEGGTGTAGTAGHMELVLGNSTAVNENTAYGSSVSGADNACGYLTMYSPGTKYMQIRTANISGQHILYLPRINTGSSTYYGKLISMPSRTSSGVDNFSDVGSGVKPIYVTADGVATASSSTVGSGVIPMYLSSGTLTASTSTVGSGVKPIYLSSGTLTVSSSTVGSGVKPVYLNSGEITVSSSTVGSGVKPIYLSSGTLTVSSSSLGGTAKPIYMDSGELKAISATVGSGVKPVYLSSGTITVSSSSVGGTAQPVYLSSGEIKSISATVGSATKPVYLSSGTITVGTYELKATINAGTATRFAYYSGANAISSYSRIGTIGSARYPLDFTLHNDAGTKVAEFWYDQGTTTNVTSGSWRFRAWSPKSTADTGVTSYYENYFLPTVTTGRTSDASYNILTTKDLSFSITGSAQKVGIAGIWLYPNNNNEINFGGTNTSDTIYFGYRATDSRPKPATFVFGSGSGTATIKAAVLVTSNHGTGNPGSSTAGNGVTGALYFKRI